MKRAEYLEKIETTGVDPKTVAKIEMLYGHPIPTYIQKMVSFSEESVFFDDGYRTLSLAEILDAEKDLHVDFVGQNMIPLLDCGDNDFVVYLFHDELWPKFNIVDACFFKRRASLRDLI